MNVPELYCKIDDALPQLPQHPQAVLSLSQGNRTMTVIPAKAGIQRPNSLTPFPIRSPIPSWTPAFAGVTGV